LSNNETGYDLAGGSEESLDLVKSMGDIMEQPDFLTLQVFLAPLVLAALAEYAH
jgi:hypothetical protein